MRRLFPKFSRGAIALVALSFVSVLGLVLAGYFAISQQSMRLSNRSYGATVSEQLAELGLEEALRALNTNDFSDWTSGTSPNQTAVDWTLSGTTATATITPPATRYGNAGVAGTAKIRIDNYDAYNRPATWANSTAYRIGDLIGSAGIWYRCVQNHTSVTSTNQPPNLTFWVPAPIPWQWSSDINYALYDVVNYLGLWYRCIATTASGTAPTPGTSWSTIPASRAWATGTTYAINDVVRAANAAGDTVLYRCTIAHTAGGSFTADAANWSSAVVSLSTTWTRSTVYTRGALVFENGAWYLCASSHTSASTFATDLAASPPLWSLLTTTTASWRSTISYVVGDYVYSGSTWYRCTANSLNNTPPNASFWTTTNALPHFSWAFRTTTPNTYAYNRVVFYSASGAGTWYRCTAAYTGTTLPTATSNWENALAGGTTGWVSGLNYVVGDSVHYGTNGLWYRCIRDHTSSASILPTSTTYWSTAPRLLNAWDSGRRYVVDDVVTYGGVWYRCLVANNGSNPSTNSTNWGAATNAATNWNSTTAYTTASRVTYGNVWYRCILANTNIAPHNATYWTAMGAPVAYTEGTATLMRETVPLRTQLRANVAPAPLVPNAVASNTTLTVNGAGTVDSYDSQNGTYASQTKGFSAVLAAGTSATVTNTVVRGYVAAPSAVTSPFAPAASFGGSAAVTGTLAGTTVDQTRVSRSPFIPQFGTLPSPSLNSAMTSANFYRGTEIQSGDLVATMNIGTPGGTVPTRYYYDGNLDLGSSYSCVTLNILGPVILYVDGYLRVRSGGMIDIKATGSLEVHCEHVRTYAGGHGFFNRTLDPLKLTVIADNGTATYLSTTTYLDNGNSATNKDFYGVLYIPNTTATLGLDVRSTSTNPVNIYGAISAKEVTFSTDANVHYDTTLRSTFTPGVERAFLLTDWRELTNPAERVTLP